MMLLCISSVYRYVVVAKPIVVDGILTINEPVRYEIINFSQMCNNQLSFHQS